MKYLLLVHHNEDMFKNMPEGTRKDMLADSIQLCHQLDSKRQYIHASPLQPETTGTVVRVQDGKPTVIDGPFMETKEQLAGYWLWNCKSKEQAIDWVKRCPNPMPGESEIEIRQVFEADDFGTEFTPKLREQEERIRAQTAKKL